MSHGERYTRKVVALDKVVLVGHVAMGDPSQESGGDVPPQWFHDATAYGVWYSLFIVTDAGQAPKVHWPRAVRWVFKEPLRQEDFEPFSGWYIGEAFRLKWGQGDGCTSSAFKQWSHTGGFLADWVYGEFMSRCGSVHKKFRVIGNWTCCHQTRIARHCTRTSRHPCVLLKAPHTRSKHCYCLKNKAP